MVEALAASAPANGVEGLEIVGRAVHSRRGSRTSRAMAALWSPTHRTSRAAKRWCERCSEWRRETRPWCWREHGSSVASRRLTGSASDRARGASRRALSSTPPVSTPTRCRRPSVASGSPSIPVVANTRNSKGPNRLGQWTRLSSTAALRPRTRRPPDQDPRGQVLLGPTARFQSRKDDYEEQPASVEEFLEPARHCSRPHLADLIEGGTGIRRSSIRRASSFADFMIRPDQRQPGADSCRRHRVAGPHCVPLDRRRGSPRLQAACCPDGQPGIDKVIE